MNAAITIAIFAIVFALIYRGTVDRRTAVLVGAAVMLSYGSAAGFYSLQMAADAIYFETLALILGMSIISRTLDRSGIFALTAARTASYSLGNGWFVLVLFSLLTYGLSLVINNLAAMVVMLPVTLTLCRRMGLNPVPILIAEIVASNLGGASTMIGDFPNMIISSAGNLHFLEFIGGMMVPCLFLLAAMLTYFQWRRDDIQLRHAGAMENPVAGPTCCEQKIDPYLLKLGLGILTAALVGFLVSDAIHVQAGWIAFLAGMAALCLGQFEKENLFAACGGGDIVFFAALFVMVGGLVAANVLDGFVWLINDVSGGYGLARLVVFMWMAAFATIFLNAGPATAFFVPVATEMYTAMADSAVWWALSLGVLAGSSAALTGATAGAVAASHMQRFVTAHPETLAHIPPGEGLDFKGYARWGLPIMGIFLGLSTFYLALVAK